MRYFITLSLFFLVSIFDVKSQDLVSGGTNTWILHTPDDGRTSLHIAPLIDNSYNWEASTVLSSNGDIRFSGNVGIGSTSIDNAQGWNKVLDLHGNVHAKLLVTESSGVKTGIFSHSGYNAKIGTESNHDLTLMAGYWNDVMTLTTKGNVGIGIYTPSEKLSVNGNIRAKEVKVEASNWPDYVYKKGYNLSSLEQLAKHIEEKGHLPNIPTASEVEKNGISLGEMNKKLLEKIEELTIYIIQQQNDLKKQSQDINSLKNEVDELKNLLKQAHSTTKK